LKIVEVAGFLGSGKTTTILKIAERLGRKGATVAVVVNSLGGVPVDGLVFRESGLNVKEIGGGCICCELAVNLAHTIRLLKETYDPDFVMIEPVGLAIPKQVMSAVRASKLEVEISPVLVLFDITDAEASLDEERLGHLVVRQIKGADVIAINKIDAVDEDAMAKTESVLKALNPSAPIIRISALKEIGLDELLQLLVVANET